MPFPADGKKVKLGKGSLLLDQLTTAGVKQGFEFVGNCTALTLSADVTTAELFSSTQASAPLVARAPTRTAYTITATLSEYTLANLRKFLLAEQSSKQQQSLQNNQAFINGVKQGRYYDIGARQITNVQVSVGSQLKVLNEDYTLNAEFGIIRPLVGGSIPDDSMIVVDFTQPALTIDQLRIAQVAAPVCHLLYLSDDANQDGDAARDRLEIWRVNVAPEGELNLISDEYGSYQLTMAVLSDGENHPADPFGTLDRVRAA